MNILESKLPNIGEIIIYESDSSIHLEVRIENDTVWLTQAQMVKLFDRDKSVISRHISNIFKEEELVMDSVVANFATTAAAGKTYQVEQRRYAGATRTNQSSVSGNTIEK